MSKIIRFDFFVVIGMVLLFIPTILFFKVRFLTSTFLFFAVPAAYLFIRKPKQYKRLIATLCVGMVGSFIVDFLAEINGAWSWAPEGQLLFPDKLFGLIPIDVLIWYFFWIILTIVHYEHFFEHDRKDKVSPAFKKVLFLFLSILAIVVITFLVNSELLLFPYAYLYIALVGSTPFFYVIAKKPRLIGKLLKASLFNIFLFLSFELTALYLDQWRFPVEYIGYVNIWS